MVPRLRSTLVVCAVLLLGGAIGGGGGGEVFAAPSFGPAPSVGPAPFLGPAPSPATPRSLLDGIEAARTIPLLARRTRVKRRRVWEGDRLRARLDPSGAHRSLRSPAADRLLRGRARARARIADRAARAGAPASRSARLGRSSTWCTSVPPPRRLPLHSV